MATSYASAQANGILTNGTDQTSALNTLLSNTAYSGIIFDFSAPGAVTINGTVSAGGKIIQFLAGNTLTGTGGILDRGQISAGYMQKCFDTTISLTSCTTSSDRFSVMWYGADPALGDNQPAFQKSSDTVIANTTMTRDLYLPPGVYAIQSPWILYVWTGSAYGQFTINIIGDYNIENSNFEGIARIKPSFNDTFAIGVQRGYSGMIFGVSIEGTFTTSLSFDDFVNTSFGSISTSRDSQFSPNAGIVIDPFTNGQSVPGPGGYPSLSAWYRGDNSNGGTTSFKISNCYIAGFTIDICNSPNGSTQQGEDCVIENCQLNYAKVAIAYCQTQSDNCTIHGIRSWYYLWTVIDTVSYGPQKGYVANISTINIAGAVNQIFNVVSDKPIFIEKVYAESFFTFGNLASGAGGATLIGSTFDFAISPTNLQPQTHGFFGNAAVIGCRMRYYDDLFNKRLRITTGNTVFKNTFFDQPPFFRGQDQSQVNTCRFENCSIGAGNQVLGMNTDMFDLATAQLTPVLYGDFKLQNGFGLDVFTPGGNPITPALTFQYHCTNFNRVLINFGGGVTITPDGSRSATFTSSLYYLAQVNDILQDDVSGNVIGRISAISLTTITVSEIPINIVSGTYNLDLIYYLTALNPIIGDITGGSPLITNVCPLFPGYINVLAAGSRFDHPTFPKGAYIVSYNSGTGVLTMSANADKTATRQNFLNGNPEVEARGILPPNSAYLTAYNIPLPTGTRWIELVTAFTASLSTPTTWVFNKGGYVDAAALGLSGAYQADFNIEPLLRNNSGTIQYYDTYADTWINV
jgi:hypothetical protein